MKIESLNKSLKGEAIELGLCAAWQRMWRNGWSREELIRRYKEGIDFCIQHEYPSNEFIKENFSRDLLRDNTILVDDRWSFVNPKTTVLQGSSESIVRYNGWNAGTVYVRHESRAVITAKTMSYVIVHLFDNAVVECTATDKASIVVIRHDENTTIAKNDGNVKIEDEFDYLK